jgi:hypothetical protein
MKLYTKDQLIAELRKIFAQGWHQSTKKTINARNDGAVGNTLEDLLGIEENNLPIPNAREWELKGQRAHTTSLVTLKHIEPSPTAAKIVPNLLLPLYGWRHQEAGKRHPKSEMSFRSTTSAADYTNRGFRIVVDRDQRKLRFIFDSSRADTTNSEIASWLDSVKKRAGKGPLNPEPYWGFDDIKYKIGSKIRNCFYVVAEAKKEKGHEFFKYEKLFILSDFSFEKFLMSIEDGVVYIEFDARTGHNHGTKFRVRQGNWEKLYASVERVI